MSDVLTREMWMVPGTKRHPGIGLRHAAPGGYLIENGKRYRLIAYAYCGTFIGRAREWAGPGDSWCSGTCKRCEAAARKEGVMREVQP